MKQLIFVLLCVLVESVPVLEAANFPLIRNGDFTLRHGNRLDMRQSWIAGHTMKFEPAESPDELPCVLMNRGNGAIHQELRLVPGAYVVSVEVNVSPKGKAKVRAGDAFAEQGETSDWKHVFLKFACDGKPVRITLDNPTGAGEVRFRDVRVEAEKPRCHCRAQPSIIVQSLHVKDRTFPWRSPRRSTVVSP